MADTCQTLNFIQNKDVTDNLDKYVVLAFVVTLFLTIVVALLLVKYITYNMSLDRKRESKIAARTTLPALSNDEVEDDDSSDDGMVVWSDDEDDQGNSPKGDLDTPSVNTVLETNYVEPDNKGDGGAVGKQNLLQDKTSDQKVADLDVRWLAQFLKLPDSLDATKNTPPSQLLRDVFTTSISKSSATVKKVTEFPSIYCFNQLMNQTIGLRNFVSLQIINFTIDLLFEQKVLEQEETLRLKSKYEQRLETNDDCSDTEVVFTYSKKIFVVIQEFVQDLQEASVERKVLAETVTLLFNQPLNCLKVMLLTTPDHAKACVETAKSFYSGVSHFENVLLMIAGRSFFFRSAVQKNKKSTDALVAGFDEETTVVVEEFVSEFDKLFVNQFRKSNNVDHLFMKLEQEINGLKLKFRNSKGRNLSKKLETLGECLKGLLVSHLENSAQFVTDKQGEVIAKCKQSLGKLQKIAVQRMQAAEEKCLTKLQDDLKFTEKEINRVVDETRNSLKALLTEYDDLKVDIGQKFVARQENISRLLNLSIDHTVRLVSTRYRVSFAASVSWVKSWPVLSEKSLTKLETLMRGKMGMVSFDVVVALMKHLYHELGDVFSMNIPTVEIESKLKQPIDSFVKSSVLKQFDSVFQMPDQFLNAFHQTCHETVTRAFGLVHENLKQSLQNEVQNSVQRVYNENLEIYNLYQEHIEQPPTPEENTRKKKKDYLSRKRSTLKEKTLEDRFKELYDGLKEVKEHRYQEKLQELQQEMKQKTSKTFNSSSNNQEVKELHRLHSELLQRREFVEKQLSTRFDMDQYYMRDMLLKKLKEMISNKDINTPGNADNADGGDSDDVYRGEVDKRKPTKSNTSKSKPNSPRKASAIVPKKRKSRRVRDSVA